MKVTWRVTKHKQENICHLLGFEFLVTEGQTIVRPTQILALNFPAGSAGVMVKLWGCDGGCGGVMVTVHAVLAPLLPQGPAC